MKCMLSFSNYQANMEQQEHINIWNSNLIKTKGEVKIHRPTFFWIPPISSQWIGHMMHQIHAVHCRGTFSQRMTVDIWRTTTHTKKINRLNSFKSSQDIRVIAKIWYQWSDTFSWSLMSSMWYVRLKSHEYKRVSVSLTYGDGFSSWMLKYIYNLNIGTNSLLSLIYTLE